MIRKIVEITQFKFQLPSIDVKYDEMKQANGTKDLESTQGRGHTNYAENILNEAVRPEHYVTRL